MKIALFVMSLGFVLLLSSQRSFACDPTTESDASDGSCKNSDCTLSCPYSGAAGGGGGIGSIVRLNPPGLLLREHKTDYKLAPLNIPRSVSWDRLMVDPAVIAVHPDLSTVCLGMCFARGDDVAPRSNLLPLILKGEA